MLLPPSSCRLMPVTNSDSRLARYTAASATSAASPSRVRCMPSYRDRRAGVDVGVAPRVQDVAGADRVAADARGGVVDRDRPGERVEPALGRDVRGEARARPFRLPRRDVHDRAAARPLEVRQRLAAQPERCGEVDAEDRLPRVGGQVAGATVAAGSSGRVVHEHGQARRARARRRATSSTHADSSWRSAGRNTARPPASVMVRTTSLPRSASRPVTATRAP